ncbi:MAG: radical SAM protein [Oscillospiraceae bacterium]|nr:radical SAM protein [Oscillospiraceae bacterium]
MSTDAMNVFLSYSLNCETVPKSIVFELTKDCNLNCKHCYNPRGNSKDLDVSHVKLIIDKIPNPEEVFLGFTGGEVLVRKDILEIIAHASGRKFKSINIDTNGILLTPAFAEQIFESGVRYVQLSVDGLEKTHDYIRGVGAFQKLVDNLPGILKTGIIVTANMTVHKKNMHELFDLWRFLSKYEIGYMKIEPLVSMGRGKRLTPLLLNKNDIYQICKVSERIILLGEKPELILDNLFTSYYKNEPSLGCPAGKSFCIITHEGKMVHCPVCTGMATESSSLLNNGFIDIWENNILLKKIRNIKNYQECCKCIHRNKCSGGCHVRAYAKRGNLFDKDPMCIFER